MGKKFAFPIQVSANGFVPAPGEYNKKHGTRLSAAQFIARTLTEAWEHPVKSMMFGWAVKQDKLKPGDLQPSRVQFYNTGGVG
jgi:hypothetical protein